MVGDEKDEHPRFSDAMQLWIVADHLTRGVKNPRDPHRRAHRYKMGMDVDHDGVRDQTELRAPSPFVPGGAKKTLGVMSSGSHYSSPLKMLGKGKRIVVKVLPNPGSMKLVGARLSYIQTTGGVLRPKGRAALYGMRDGSVFARGFFGKAPAGLVTRVEYFDDGKVKREGMRVDGRPWRHDFTKERRPIVRVSGGVLIPAGKRPLWGMR
jgi:hypothetical protein